jgi:hypothetical protein
MLYQRDGLTVHVNPQNTREIAPAPSFTEPFYMMLIGAGLISLFYHMHEWPPKGS